MENAKHTPVPWILVPQGNGSYIVAHEFETQNQMHPKGLRLICTVFARGDSLKEDIENARLIAAAPELLEALKEVVAISDRKHNAWDKAKTVIAKAEGVVSVHNATVHGRK